MADFLLSSFSLMALIIMLTALLFITSLLSTAEKADYKNWLIIYFSGLLLWHAMGFLSGGLHSDAREQTFRYTNTLFNFGLAVAGLSYIQAAYLFPQKAFEKERKWVGTITAALCFLYVGSVIWFHFIQDQQGLSSTTYGRFVNPLAGLFGLITTSWAAIVFVRKALYFRRRQSTLVIPLRLLSLCTCLLLAISFLFIYPGGNHSWVIIVYTYGMWIFLQAEVIIYIIYSAFPIRFRPKLIGFLFAGVMAILSVTTMVIVPFTTNAETASNLAQRVNDQPILMRLLLIILGSAAFVLLVFPVILKESVTKPLERLLRGIMRADAGDLTVNIPCGMMDEIGILTCSFNGMVHTLKLSKDELTHHANTLESEVTKRTFELSNSLKELKATQRQLIHAEKMASLGELTAGIAHEIQNPLNFVNNFSETNIELLEELEEEADKGNLAEVKERARSIRENENKIVFHGRKAETIVKGMLQHSQGSTGQEQPTDINALAEEYLRLSYKDFLSRNAALVPAISSFFDESVGQVSVVPQDLGRVLTNLYNNAFYAVCEKKKKVDDNFVPRVSVSTKREGDNIRITVCDNGTGMSPKVIEKIFQPFFTTKPTGEGTGLGLSLSYEIITKGHGGNLSVYSKEGEGTEFVVHLPA